MPRPACSAAAPLLSRSSPCRSRLRLPTKMKQRGCKEESVPHPPAALPHPCLVHLFSCLATLPYAPPRLQLLTKMRQRGCKEEFVPNPELLPKGEVDFLASAAVDPAELARQREEAEAAARLAAAATRCAACYMLCCSLDESWCSWRQQEAAEAAARAQLPQSSNAYFASLPEARGGGRGLAAAKLWQVWASSLRHAVQALPDHD